MSFSAHYELPATPTASPSPVSTNAFAPVSDVLLFHVPDGGEIEILNGAVTLCDGLATSVYLSLFGGNEDDSGIQGDDRKQWWGNLTESDPARAYRSRTQNLLRTLNPIPANLRRLEDAAQSDCQWMVPSVASRVTGTAKMPALNRVQLDLEVVVDDVAYQFSFVRPWGASSG